MFRRNLENAKDNTAWLAFVELRTHRIGKPIARYSYLHRLKRLMPLIIFEHQKQAVNPSVTQPFTSSGPHIGNLVHLAFEAFGTRCSQIIMGGRCSKFECSAAIPKPFPELVGNPDIAGIGVRAPCITILWTAKRTLLQMLLQSSKYHAEEFSRYFS